MGLELKLNFTDPKHVTVALEDSDSGKLAFTNPLTEADQKDIRWYLETYAASYITEVDVEGAERIAKKLPIWGEALFQAVFTDLTAYNLYARFLNQSEPGRLVTVRADHPDILSLPWELLRDPTRT